MRRRRALEPAQKLCSGPGKLTEALGIDGRVHGRDLCASPAHGIVIPPKSTVKVVADLRVGITRAADFPWRFLAADSPFVSVRPSSLARKV